MKKAKIKIVNDGPFVVFGNISLATQIIGVNQEGDPDKWIQGKKYPLKNSYSLCRCGESEKKPFCDGSHLLVNFVGTEIANRKSFFNMAEEVDGPTLKLFDVLKLCSVARFCYRTGGTWKLTRESDDPKSRKIASEETGDCPSGRLVIRDKKTEKIIEPSFKFSISIVEDPQKRVSGPLWVTGGVPIESSDGFGYEIRNRCTLCRCGKSSNKPFCSGTHIEIGFNDGDESLK